MPETAITARQYGRPIPFGGEALRNPKHHGSLAGAADRQIADAYYDAGKPPVAQEARLIKLRSQAHGERIKQPERL